MHPLSTALLILVLLFTAGTSPARWLDPKTGRFQTMDSYDGNIEEPASLHKYTYCQGNPVNNADLSGHDIISTFSTLTTMAYLRTSQFVAAHPIITAAAIVAIAVVVPQLEAIPPGEPGPFDEMGQIGRAVRGTSSRSFSVLVRYFKGGNRAVPATTLLAGAGDELAEAAKWVVSRQGYYDVIVHGSEHGLQVLHNGQWVEISHRSLAEFMKKNGYSGGPVRLISCSTGGSPTGVAKNLANKLGAEIIAPTDTVWIHPSGNLTIGADAKSNTGSWERFTPGGGQ